MKTFWRYIEILVLSVTACSLVLLTGCGSYETVAGLPQDNSSEAVKEVISETTVEQSTPVKEQT